MLKFRYLYFFLLKKNICLSIFLALILINNATVAQSFITNKSFFYASGFSSDNVNKKFSIPQSILFSINNSFLNSNLIIKNISDEHVDIVDWNNAINRNELTDYSSVIVDSKNRYKYMIIDLIEKHTSIYFLTFIEKNFNKVVLNIGYHAFPTTILKDTYSENNTLELKNFTSAYIILGLLGFSIIYKL